MVPTLAKLVKAVTEPVIKPVEVLTLLAIAETTPVPVVVVAGAAPAPPPIIIAFAAKSAEDVHALPELK
jgi:hypothetical protein